MPDLKAAANTLAVFRKNIMRDNSYCNCRACNPANWPESNGWKCVTSYRSDALLLAAQALEALAWMKESRFVLDLDTTGSQVWWNCYLPFSGQYYQAETPLGALLAAMEGEKDGD